MKAIFLILTSFCISVMVHAQKDFHGEIIYKLHASGEAQPDAELKVLFGERKLKLTFKEKDEYNKDALIVFLDSGVTYSINATEKMFNRKMLASSMPLLPAKNKTIAGYTTTPFQPEKNGLGGLVGRLIGSSDATFYLADSLTYFVPEKYWGNMEFVIIQHNKIILGAELQMVNPSSDEEDDSSAKNNQLITTEAISIKQMPITESEFIIPSDYTDRKNISFQPPVIVDTTAVMVDSTVAAPKLLPIKKKIPVKPIKNKAGVNSPAAKRKE